MKSFKKVSLQELKELHHANGGFHDAELSWIELDEGEKSIRLLFKDLRSFVGESGLPEQAAKEIELKFDGVVLLSALNPNLLLEYGVNQFEIGESGTVCVETVMGNVRFSFTSVSSIVRD